MAQNEALRNWLEKPGRDFHQNLTFGIKLLKSLEFPSGAKYEVITDFFCQNLHQHAKSVKKSGDFEAWKVVTEFVGLSFPRNSGNLQSRILETLCRELKVVPAHETAVETIVTALESFRDFFKFNSLEYARSCGGFLSVLERFEQIPQEQLEKIVQSIFLFAKSARINLEVRQLYFEHILEPLARLSMAEVSPGVRKFPFIKESSLALSQQLFFTDENLEKYNWLFEKSPSDDLVDVFDPKTSSFEALLLNVEAYFRAYRVVSCTCVEFLFLNLFKPQKGGGLDTSKCLRSLNEVFRMLKSYEIKIEKASKADDFDIIGFLREEMETLCSDFYETHLEEVLNLVVTCVGYNPLIMERKAFAVLVNCMFVEKTPEVQKTYEEFTKTIIRMTKSLRGGEAFVVYLIKAVREKFAEGVPKGVKRKAKKSQVSAKKLKLESGEALEVEESESTETRFKDLASAWPYAATEEEFAKLVTLLVSKQTRYMWKLLTEFLSDELEGFQPDDDSKVFLIDLVSALLCQFFGSTLLAEHSHLQWDALEERCTSTKQVLGSFGRKILSVEHNRRLMTTFLTLCHDFAAFQTMLWHYCPDSFETDPAKRELMREGMTFLDVREKSRGLLDFLTTDEWKLIEQRVKNFGRLECSKRLNWVNLSQARAFLTFRDEKKFKKSFPAAVEPVEADPGLLIDLLGDFSMNEWVLQRLELPRMFRILSAVVPLRPRLVINEQLLENEAFLEAATLSVFQGILKGQVKVDFETILERDLASFSNQVKELVAQEPEISVNKELLGILKELPFGYSSKEAKTCIFGLLMVVKTADCAREVADLALPLFVFEECPSVLEHFSLSEIRKIFHEPCFDGLWQEMLNQLVFYMTPETHEALKKLAKRFKKEETDESKFLSTKVLKCLSTVHYVKSKVVSKEDIEKLEHKFADSVYEFISRQVEGGLKEKAFRETFEMFQALMKSYIKRKNKTDDQVEGHNALLATYLELMFSTNSDSLGSLATLVLENRSKFTLDEKTTKKLLDVLWEVFLTDLRSQQETPSSIKSQIALIYDLKSQPEMEELILQIGQTWKSDPAFQCRIFQSIAEHAITRNKTTACLAKNESFSNLYRSFVIQLKTAMPLEIRTVKALLRAHTEIMKNVRIPVVQDLVDEVLQSLVRVEVQKFKVTSGNVEDFVELHQLMAELLFVLIAVRTDATLNFLQAFLMVYEGLLAAISSYKSDRSASEQLSTAEINQMADLAHKLEKIMSKLIQNAKALKLTAPFLITFVITAMVSNKQSPIAHEKVKNVFKNICFALISIIDDHHHKFILRSSDEACRDIYSILFKEYKKFREFRGRV